MAHHNDMKSDSAATQPLLDASAISSSSTATAAAAAPDSAASTVSSSSPDEVAVPIRARRASANMTIVNINGKNVTATIDENTQQIVVSNYQDTSSEKPNWKDRWIKPSIMGIVVTGFTNHYMPSIPLSKVIGKTAVEALMKMPKGVMDMLTFAGASMNVRTMRSPLDINAPSLHWGVKVFAHIGVAALVGYSYRSLMSLTGNVPEDAMSFPITLAELFPEIPPADLPTIPGLQMAGNVGIEILNAVAQSAVTAGLQRGTENLLQRLSLFCVKPKPATDHVPYPSAEVHPKAVKDPSPG